MKSLWKKMQMCLMTKGREKKEKCKVLYWKRQRVKITQQTSLILVEDYDFYLLTTQIS